MTMRRSIYKIGITGNKLCNHYMYVSHHMCRVYDENLQLTGMLVEGLLGTAGLTPLSHGWHVANHHLRHTCETQCLGKDHFSSTYPQQIPVMVTWTCVVQQVEIPNCMDNHLVTYGYCLN